MMSGEKKSAKERLSSYETVLNDYKEKLAISKIPLSSDVDKYLAMDKATLSGLSPEECAEAAFILKQYAAFLQIQMNRHNTRLIWGEDELDKLVISQAENYGYTTYMKYEILKYKVINGDEAAKVLNQIVIRAKTIKSELYDISNRVSDMANELKGIQISKNKRG